MQFKVPQFIDIEDKVFGNLTFKQFAYLAGGGGFTYLTFKLLPTLIALPIAGVFIALSLALAFFKYNEKPFIHTLEAFVKFYSRSRLYLWHKQDVKAVEVQNKIPTKTSRGTLTESKLQTLSWSLDVIDPKK
jgi:hypothetical protein